jgi:C1A family cysteine protease
MKLGYIKDKPDPRDLHINRLGLNPAIPTEYSLEAYVVEVLNQMDQDCVANAWAQALRMADGISGVKNPELSSRRFIYYNARKYDGGPIIDQGTQLRSAAAGITKFGRPPETITGYDESSVNAQPEWEAYKQGYDFRGPAGYYRCTSNDDTFLAISNEKPVVGGTQVGQSIEQYTSGIYDPDPNEPKIGGHAMAVVAYTPDYALVVGSWGPSYGINGFVKISYRYLATFSDRWAVHL